MAFGRSLASAAAYAEERKAEMAADLDTNRNAMFQKLAVRSLSKLVLSSAEFQMLPLSHLSSAYSLVQLLSLKLCALVDAGLL